jgi:hypothetical protein
MLFLIVRSSACNSPLSPRLSQFVWRRVVLACLGRPGPDNGSKN